MLTDGKVVTKLFRNIYIFVYIFWKCCNKMFMTIIIVYYIKLAELGSFLTKQESESFCLVEKCSAMMYKC